MARRNVHVGKRSAIDSHCHLADETFAADLEEVVRRAKDAGVERVLVILEAGNDKEAAQARRVEQLWPEARVPSASIRISAPVRREPGARGDDGARAVRGDAVGARAIGEIGLDYHYDFSPRDVQHAVFRAQVRLARELDQPVVIHTREADDDTSRFCARRAAGSSAASCTASPAPGAGASRPGPRLLHLARRHHHVPEGRGAARDRAPVPLDRLLTETDSPFLAPVPYRGQAERAGAMSRTSWHALAELHQIDAAELARQHDGATSTRLFRP